jgi:hypothetical protein
MKDYWGEKFGRFMRQIGTKMQALSLGREPWQPCAGAPYGTMAA